MSKQQVQEVKQEAEQHKRRKTHQFRLYPTHNQRDVLEEWLSLCCETYNAALAYEHQCAELPGCKEVRPELREVPSQVLQEAVKRVDLAFEAFFRRVENAEKPGYPCFFRASRKLSRAHRGSKERAKKRTVVARVHERIGNHRKSFIEQEVCKLIKRFGVLAVEALVVSNMMRHPKLASGVKK